MDTWPTMACPSTRADIFAPTSLPSTGVPRRCSWSVSSATLSGSRRADFLDYMNEHYPDCIVRSLFIDPDDPVRTDQELDYFFEAFPGTTHVAMFNSRIYLIVPWLERHPAQIRRVVGFDNLTANMNALARGTVSALIAQHPDEQVAMGIQALFDYIVLGKKPARRDNFMHMDILTRYNIEYY